MIGHDIRNPLQTITGELFLLKQEMDALPKSPHKTSVQESLCAIQEQTDYIGKIISDLQDFARPLKPEMGDVDLQVAIPQLLSTVVVPSNISVVQQFENKVRVEADSTFLKRILVNLVTNAIQAMPDGGKLAIKAFHDNNNVNVTLSDTGVGIPDEVKTETFPAADDDQIQRSRLRISRC